MDFDEYQRESAATIAYEGKPIDPLVYCALKLNGEAGEIAEKVGKLYRDKNGELGQKDAHAIALELGDCLWYIARLAEQTGYTLGQVALMNQEKLRNRQKAGTLQGSGDNR